MHRSALILFAALLPNTVIAKDISDMNQICVSQKYHQYIDASISWYESLTQLTIKADPALKDVSDWFLEGRRNHFQLNEKTFDWYLKNEPSRLNFNVPVESWLSLTQEDIKTLSTSQGELAGAAKKVFNFRQGKAHDENYELRSALADILSHQNEIEAPLQRYNNEMLKLSETVCDKKS